MHRQSLLRASLFVARTQRRSFTTAPEAPPSPPPPPDTSQTKVRRARLSSSSAEAASAPSDPEPLPLPDTLDVLWSHHPQPSFDHDLLPPEIFQDALNNLLISLHPKTQHHATFPSPLGPPTEPTFALYCPIEGADDVIDATVRELARQTRAEVLVLDSIHLAAGEWGHFGPAASSLSLPRNPLHFPSLSPSHHSNAQSPPDEDDIPDEAFQIPRRMTLAVIPSPALHARAIIAAPSPRRSAPPSKIKVFFDTLVNMPSDPSTSKARPRLIYIRDFPTLAATSSVWYPPLLSAVRARRRGPISRPSSPVCNPMTIIFGITPPLTLATPSFPPPTTGIISLLANRSSTAYAPPQFIPGKPAEWGEDEAAEIAREKRLRERLRKWDRGESLLLDELPKLSMSHEGETTEEAKSDIILVSSPGFSPPFGADAPSSITPSSQTGVPYFRTSILVPRLRDTAKEQEARTARRREINELTMRMGVGAAGGILDQQTITLPVATQHAREKAEEPLAAPPALSMWEDWGNKIQPWLNVRRIADLALGRTLAVERANENFEDEKVTLDATVVSWSAVQDAWAIYRSSKDLRMSLLKDTFAIPPAQEQEEKEMDRVIEMIKNDEDLDPHEQRLLSCIVDAASMPTSFDQVHLPSHTIDSVRTVVSLPLLQPHAFQHGILKDHAMTGCLLFGPPGTGKTLVVRALAKEAGCRMLTISPSDVMDMYVGEGEKLVKAVFSLARKLAPCVVFLDEIDALFGARMSARESGGAFAHRGVITEFMQEMDGLKSSKEDRVIVIGATNRPFDLDDAVLRRLPRRLLVDLPGEKERVAILKILLHNETLADDMDVEALAKQTEGFSGSDLKHLCVSAALDAVKENVKLPWSTTTCLDGAHNVSRVPPQSTSTLAEPAHEQSDDEQHHDTRILRLHNFAKALKEITPSSSESLGSLAELRKWNEEFGEGMRQRKRQQIWGKGRFGFTDKQREENVKVLASVSDRTNRLMYLT